MSELDGPMPECMVEVPYAQMIVVLSDGEMKLECTGHPMEDGSVAVHKLDLPGYTEGQAISEGLP